MLVELFWEKWVWGTFLSVVIPRAKLWSVTGPILKLGELCAPQDLPVDLECLLEGHIGLDYERVCGQCIWSPGDILYLATS